jgi:hypothetical protein
VRKWPSGLILMIWVILGELKILDPQRNVKISMDTKTDYLEEGEKRYQKWREEFMADPENRRIYEEEAKKKNVWLKRVEARQVKK